MKQEIEQYQEQILASLEQTQDLKALGALRADVFGKKSPLSAWLKALGGLEPEARKTQGEFVNLCKTNLTQAFEAHQSALEAKALEARFSKEKVDVTLPSPGKKRGFFHPLAQTLKDIKTIFQEMGFSVQEGPDIEDEFHNFTALNIPPHHPARAEQDTFYLPNAPDGKQMLLRTHTSPVQIRTMLQQKPPLRFIAPGKVYRCDDDPTHAPMFHQVEGVVLEPGVHMGHLKGCLEAFCRTFFEKETLALRFRPGFFPFTEPSAEVDLLCDRQGAQLKIGEGSDWLEVLGCGMIHPAVLTNVGIDPTQHQGFAFGMGVERLAMLKYGIGDLRRFFENDQRWLAHYGF
ncbi:MAG: phenylalanine--tRNA ligase subunit alpha [Alphaproteobacteria bacterium]